MSINIVNKVQASTVIHIHHISLTASDWNLVGDENLDRIASELNEVIRQVINDGYSKYSKQEAKNACLSVFYNYRDYGANEQACTKVLDSILNYIYGD